MEQYTLKPTGSTPSVTFNSRNGTLNINGISTPFDSLSFYGHIYNLLEQFDEIASDELNVNIALKKISNSQAYLSILVKKLISLTSQNRKVNINWYYENNNDEILTTGKDISRYYDYPFNFKEVFKINYHLLQAS